MQKPAAQTSNATPADQMRRNLKKELTHNVGESVAKYVMERLDLNNLTAESIEELIREGKQQERETASELAAIVSQTRLTG